MISSDDSMNWSNHRSTLVRHYNVTTAQWSPRGDADCKNSTGKCCPPPPPPPSPTHNTHMCTHTVYIIAVPCMQWLAVVHGESNGCIFVHEMVEIIRLLFYQHCFVNVIFRVRLQEAPLSLSNVLSHCPIPLRGHHILS